MEPINRRKFIKCSTMACATIALLPRELPAKSHETPTASAGAAKPKGVKGGPTPDYAKEMLTTDMQGLGPDGKPTGERQPTSRRMTARPPIPGLNRSTRRVAWRVFIPPIHRPPKP